MANKFQKSVLERLEQEAVRQKQSVPAKEAQKPITAKTEAPKKKEPMKQEPILQPQSVVAKPLPSVSAEPAQTVFTQVFQPTDIGDYLRRDTQRTAKNKTFYLDADVIELVKSTARVQGVTDSKLVNDILRRVLGL